MDLFLEAMEVMADSGHGACFRRGHGNFMENTRR